MLATAGIWLECIPDAARAFPEPISVHGLKWERQRGRGRSEGNVLIRIPITNSPHFSPSAISAPPKGFAPPEGFPCSPLRRPRLGWRRGLVRLSPLPWTRTTAPPRLFALGLA